MCNWKVYNKWITHVKLKYFSWEEKLFLGQEKREYIDNWRDFLWENKISEFNVKNNRCDYVYVNSTCQSEKKHTLNWTRILGIFHFHKLCLRKQRQIFEWVFNYSRRKSTFEMGLEFLVFFTFIMKIFIKQEHNLLSNCLFELVTYVCCENCIHHSGFSTFVLNVSKSNNILFKSMPNGSCPFSSASLSLVGDKSLVRGLTW